MEENVKAGANHMPCTWKLMSYITLFTILFPFSALTLSFQIAKFWGRYIYAQRATGVEMIPKHLTNRNKFQMLWQCVRTRCRTRVKEQCDSSIGRLHEFNKIETNASHWWASCTNRSQLKRDRVCWWIVPQGDLGLKGWWSAESLSAQGPFSPRVKVSQ